MGSLPYALSIHHFITTVGAYAGFAALVGLAILALLYFAQARETSSLREQMAQSAERLQQLEARLTALLRGQSGGAVQATPAPASGSSDDPLPDERTIATARGLSASAPASAPTSPSGSPPAPPGPAAAPEPAAPAGVGAPALAAATRLIPSTVSASSVPAAPRPVTAAGTALTDHPIDDTMFVPAASTAGSNGVTRAPVAAAAGYGGGSAPPAPPPRVQIRPGGAGQIGPRPDRSEGGAQSRPPRQGRRGLVALLVGLLVAGAVIALVAVISGGGGGGSQAAGTTSTSDRQAASHSTRSIAVNPRSVKIAVLNGTATAGLAHRIAAKLGGGGYSVAATTNAADQTLTTTVVTYIPGQRDAAMAVARLLGLSSAAVQPIDQGTKAIACPPPSACTTTVVVTAGADLASTA
jgi:LytR cell envelope-related transcriptional attenuator